jgi:RNA polymerase sigma-70 factor (ECF subfamily)
VSGYERHFVDVFEATYVDLMRFVARRVDRAEAEDVVAEAFTIAWRRVSDLPTDASQARAWVFGIARRLVLAHHRRTHATAVASLDINQLPTPGHEDTVVALADLARAWNRLTAAHQEALSLTCWDGLTGAEAAIVLGISPVAYRIRLSRARRALHAHLRAVEQAPQHTATDNEEVSTR